MSCVLITPCRRPQPGLSAPDGFEHYPLTPSRHLMGTPNMHSSSLSSFSPARLSYHLPQSLFIYLIKLESLFGFSFLKEAC